MVNFIEQYKEKNTILDVLHQFGVELNSQNKAPCPLPNHDDKTPSFSVLVEQNTFKCFGCGEKGDQLALAVALSGRSISDIVKDNGVSDVKRKAPKKVVEKAKKAITKKRNENLPTKYSNLHSYYEGDLEVMRAYRRDKKLLAELTEYSKANKYKAPAKLTYFIRSSTSKSGWVNNKINTNAPIYRWRDVEDRKDEWILIGEGEKVCDFLHDKGFASIGYSGGCNSIESTDWSKAKDCKFIVIADADLDGYKGARKLAKILDKNNSVVIVFPDQEEFGNGWDLADCDWDKPTINGWLKENHFRLDQTEKFAEKPQVKIDLPHHKNVKINSIIQAIGETDLFQILGRFGTDKIVCFIKDTQNIVYLPARKITANDLIFLAGGMIDFWLDECIVEGNTKATQATKIGYGDLQNFIAAITTIANSLPKFDANKLRGRGAGLDHGKPIFHYGSYIEDTTGKKANLYDTRNEFIYQEEVELKRSKETVNAAECAGFCASLQGVDFASVEDRILFIGWLVSSLIGGALKWRSHAWLSAPAGSGKTWLIANILRKFFGDYANFTSADATPAAAARIIGTSSLPFIFDEFESNSNNDSSQVDAFLKLARMASTADGERPRSNAEGGVDILTPRCSIMVASITQRRTDKANSSRFSEIQLRAGTNKGDWVEREERIAQYFDKLAPMKAYIIKNTDKILGLIKDVRDNCVGLDEREKDQISALVAGYCFLADEYTPLDIKNLAQGFSEYAKIKFRRSDDDASQLIELLMQSFIRDRDNKAVQIASALANNNTHDRLLLQHGFKVDRLKNQLIIAPRHAGVRALVKGSSHEKVNLEKLLDQLPNSEMISKPSRFGSLIIRNVIVLPLNEFVYISK